MSWIESEAIVLRHVKQGDTSRVVTLFSRTGGKVAVMAKGSRKPGSRFGAGLDLFRLSRIRYRVRAGRDLVFLDACELEKSFDALVHGVYGYAAAAVCAELVDRIVPDGAVSGDIFDLLLETLSVLAETTPLPDGEEMRAVAMTVVFQAKVMDALGIAPELTACVGCGADDPDGESQLSASRGGILCRRCAAGERGGHVGGRALDFLRAALYAEPSRTMTAARPPTKGVVLEARGALDGVLDYHHGRRPALRSLRFLDRLWREGRG